MAIDRIYVEKRPEHAVEAGAVLGDLRSVQGIANLKSVRILNRYDVEGLTEEETNERMKLREEYLIRFRKGLHQQLDNTYVVGPDGVKRKLVKKQKQ